MQYIKFALLLFLSIKGIAQVSPGYYLIEFKDKANSTFSISKPEEFLSPRAIERRHKNNIPIKEQDLPVSKIYIDSIIKIGGKVIFSSKWMNSAVVFVSDNLAILEEIEKLQFVKSSSMVRSSTKTESNFSSYAPYNYGTFTDVLKLHSGDKLHELGGNGKNVLVAAIDAGFLRVNTLPCFIELRKRNGIKKVYDVFGESEDSLYNDSRHGTLILATMASKVDGGLVGTAPEADYILIRSEINEEYPIEEEAWIRAAEYADSFGVDVINTSLGYSTFDDEKYNHTYEDLDGATARMSRAATIAAHKGIVVVNSAGNSGNKDWYYITVPADAKDIITVGAVFSNGNLANFSSRGPTADGRIKPDVMATGAGLDYSPTGLENSTNVNGTSLSSPVIAGLFASLISLHPNKTSKEIQEAVIKSSDRYHNPNNDYGYGIPNFFMAHTLLNGNFASDDASRALVYPNPTNSNAAVLLYNAPQNIDDSKLSVEIIDAMGKVLQTYQLNIEKGLNSFQLGETQVLSSGIYILRVQNSNYKQNLKLFVN